MSGLRFIVRVFDGSNSVHVGPYQEDAIALRKANGLARRAKKRGRNVSVSVRVVLPGSTSLDLVLDELDGRFAERGVYSVGSYGGRRDGA